MIILYGAEPMWGLPDPSPFVTKVEILLKIAHLPYEKHKADFPKAPKGKIPYLGDDGQLIPDSTLIRFHLEKKYGVNFDKDGNAEDVAVGWAFEKLCEDNLYFSLIHDRWLIDENFYKGPVHFFNKAPRFLRPLIIRIFRRKVRTSLHAQGNGRYTAEERLEIASRSLQELANYLSSRPFIGGAQPIGADASIFAMIWGLQNPYFKSAIGDMVRCQPPLMNYIHRMLERYYPNGV